MISELLEALERELGAHRPFAELLQRIQSGGFPVEVEGVHGGFLGVLAQRVHDAGEGPTLVVTATEQGARELLDDLRLFLPAGAAMLFPWLGTLPYARDSRPLPAVLGERARVLARLLAGEPLLVGAPLRASCIRCRTRST